MVGREEAIEGWWIGLVHTKKRSALRLINRTMTKASMLKIAMMA